ncbi:MAG: hypothetical protein KDC48_19770 [Planctomycetes bacterium]|nr:hypothetical protein [Planctomycetota bacterium]
MRVLQQVVGVLPAPRHHERAVGLDRPLVQAGCNRDDLASLRNCLAEHGNPGQRHFFDRNRPGWHELAAACGVRTVPLTLLIDREGVVREVVAGPHVLAAVERTFGR